VRPSAEGLAKTPGFLIHKKWHNKYFKRLNFEGQFVIQQWIIYQLLESTPTICIYCGLSSFQKNSVFLYALAYKSFFWEGALEFELMASHLLGKCSTTWATLAAHKVFKVCS
jgi:hypothetical protein